MATVDKPASSTAFVADAHALGWLLAAVANVGVGAWLLQRITPPAPPPLLAFILFFIAALILVIMHRDLVEQHEQTAMHIREGHTTDDRPGFQKLRRAVSSAARWRPALFVLALLLAAYTLLRLPQLDRLESHVAPFLAWLLSLICYAVALAPPRGAVIAGWRERVAHVWQQRRAALLALLGVVIVALVLRATFLEAVPYTLGGDEASQGLEAVRVLQGEIRNPFTTGWLGVPTLSFYLNSITIDILGMSKTGLRLPWALVGTATVIAAFVLVRRLHGLTLALAASALLAFYHYHIHFSRLGSNQIADPFFVTASLLFLYYALGSRRVGLWIATGATVGLAFYFYAGARFTPVIVLAVLALTFLRQPRVLLRERLRGMLAMGGALLLTAAPMLQYAVRFPDDFNARLNQVGIIQSGWLARELAGGKGLLATLWDQFHRAALAFNYYPDRTVWYGLEEPLLDPIFGALFVVGLFLGTLLLLLRGDQKVAPFVLWWWGGMVAGGALTESPPSSQRLTTLTVPVCFFIAFALWQIIQLAHRAVPRLPRWLLLAAGVAAFAAASLHLYFFEFTPQYRYGGKHAELATMLAPIFHELEETHDAYFVGAPWMYWGFSTIPYLAPGMTGQDLEQALDAPPSPDLLRPQRGAVFVVRPERAVELPLIQQTFPGGQLRELHSRGPTDELLAVVYTVPPATAP